MPSSDRVEIRSLKFLLVGATNTTLNYIIYAALIYSGLSYNLALTIDYGIGILVGYYLNRYWTFSGRGKLSYTFWKYCTTYVAVYIANMIALNIVVTFFLIGPLWGQVIALSIATIFSFVFQNYWVFRSQIGTAKQHLH